MDCVTPILNNTVSSLCNWVTIHCGYVLDLQENHNALREAKLELENIGKDVKEKVELTERQRSRRTNQVKGWLERVELLLKEVDDILQKADQQIQKKCLGTFCPGNCCSSFKLGKKVRKLISDVKELINKGHFEVVAEKLPRPPVDEKPIEKIVGIDSITGEVWNCINNDHSGDIIGLYGMGGVGKTTLLKKLNNKFLDTDHGFDLVIWVTVSKEANLEKIQDVIRRKLSISDDIWKDMLEDDRVAEIWRNLRSKIFVLLLDDVWERLDLWRIGVSLNHSRRGSKIVFSTRSEEVCYQMEVQRKVRVDCLTPEAAMDLFRHKVGEDVLNSHPNIPKLAEIVGKECKGLPLALVTIGCAMASRRSPREWQYAIEELRRNPFRFAGMRNDVFPILRFSYDSLSDDILKTCFLYCSLFPEGHNISKDELIELWIGEGFLDSSDPRNEGEYIIGTLKLTCLLERGDYAEDFVKMHDVIRDMALWLASENNNKTLVQKHVGSTKSRKFDRWDEEAVRMSLWGNVMESPREAPYCPRLRTLLVRLTVLQTFPIAFFESMPALEVLDLSYNLDLIRLPEQISLLRNLHYLNLSNTNIKELPTEIGDLRELKILLLDGMLYLDYIPQGVISSLRSLQVFSFFSTELIELQNPLSNDEAILGEFECLKHLNDLSVTLFSTEAVGRSFYSGLHRCIRRLTIMFFESRSLELRIIFHLETLKIVECFSLQSLNNNDIGGWMHPSFSKLHHVSIISCPKLEELTWLIHAPSLQFLLLRNCVSLYKIIGASGSGPSEIEESQESLFPNLIEIHLDYLPILTSIFQGTRSFPSLQTMSVTDCPILRKLPFNSESAKCLNSIRGSAAWWNQLEWEDELTMNIFASKFQHGHHMDVDHPEDGNHSRSHTPATLSFESLEFPRD